jgi:hypothetical protein
MVIYVIMSSFRTSNQEPISINYVGSNHLITGTVEGNCNTLVLSRAKTGASHEGLPMEIDAGKHNPFPYFDQQDALIKVQQNRS